MNIELSAEQKENQAIFRNYANSRIAPHADRHDHEQRISPELINDLAKHGYLAGTVPKEYGGRNMDMITFGLLNEELNRACTSVRSLVTVQSMVAHAIDAWGNEDLKKQWLSALAKGEKIAAFAMTEPEYGCDAGSIQTTVEFSDGSLILNGHKKWISYGLIADVFLVFARNDNSICALLLEKGTVGLIVEPMAEIMGTRATMLAELKFDNCTIPATNIIGNIGFGLSTVGFSALNIGRYSIAWGCVGMAQACYEHCIQYTRKRKQFGVRLRDHQLIKRKITNMMVDIKAARLMCYQAGILMNSGHRDIFKNMLMAKYFASKVAVSVTTDAVQIHGANGYSREYPVERFFRDAKIMEMIEGSNQMLQIMISRYGYKELSRNDQ